MKHKTYEDGILYNGDCLKVMPKLIQQGIKVDAIITDVPYGTTKCAWDSIIPFDLMWDNLNQLIKPKGAIVLFGSEPFSSHLRLSNERMFRYDWIWEKQWGTNFMNVNNAPLKCHEIISVFSKEKHNYYPQKYKIIELQDIMNMNKKELFMFFNNRDYDKFGTLDTRPNHRNGDANADVYGDFKIIRKEDDGYRNPKSVLKINKSKNTNLHPTQKPVALMEYLVKTYTNPNDLVLDFTCGSGSTLVACRNLNRKFIGIEKEEKYYNISKHRLKTESIKSVF